MTSKRFVPHRREDVCENCGLERPPTAAEIKCAIEHKFGVGVFDNAHEQIIAEMRAHAHSVLDLAAKL